MPVENPVTLADRLSRRRPYALAGAATLLLVMLARSVAFPDATYGAHLGQGAGWAFSVSTFLLGLLPIAGFDRGPGVRSLVNDDVFRRNVSTATAAGFWLAMGIALALFLLPTGASLAARDAIRFIVTPAAAGALYVLALLEWRALRDG